MKIILMQFISISNIILSRWSWKIVKRDFIVCMNNRVGTLFPLTCIKKNGTEVPAPRDIINKEHTIILKASGDIETYYEFDPIYLSEEASLGVLSADGNVCTRILTEMYAKVKYKIDMKVSK